MMLICLSLFFGVLILLFGYEWFEQSRWFCVLNGHVWDEIYENEGQKEPTVYCIRCNVSLEEVRNDN